jgi:hypothetical protein
VAAIGYNFVANLKQYPQSIAPYFAYASPVSIAGAAKAWMDGVGRGEGVAGRLSEGNALYREVYRKSAEIRTRVNSIQRQYTQAKKEAAAVTKGETVKKAWNKAIGAGLWGQNQADVMMTTIGWTAVYNETLAKTRDEAAAIAAADKATRESQPNTNALFTSEAFREGGGIWRGLMLFGLPLNRLLNMYGRLPRAIAERNIRYLVSVIIGQAVTGLAIAAVFGKLGDKDDDEKDRLRKAAYAALAEPVLSTIPVAVLSNELQWAAERIITGEKEMKYQNSPLPLVGAAADMVVNIAEGNTKNLLKNTVDLSGYAFGVPAAQLKRLIKAVEEEDAAYYFGMEGWSD